ncbi:MAG TPA: hypothetical protein DCG39_04755 [Opitutae bacterium]|nr:hypothetical protein [Opitutae bacterium]
MDLLALALFLLFCPALFLFVLSLGSFNREDCPDCGEGMPAAQENCPKCGAFVPGDEMAGQTWLLGLASAGCGVCLVGWIMSQSPA